MSAGEIFSGPGAAGVLRLLPAAKVAVIASASLLRDPNKASRLRDAIRAHDVLFLATSGEPALDALQPIIAELRRFAPDWIVAVGGGSTLDSGKLAWIFYEHPDAELERLLRPFSLSGMRGRARFAAVPTTAGTGSEVSSSAIFVERVRGRKRAVVSHALLPDLVVLDPDLAAGVPRRAAAAAGLDALAHAVEGYVSRFQNPFADQQAEQATRILLRDLAASAAEPADADRTLRVMQAALMAGWTQNLKVPGVGHALAHQLTRFGLPHGLCTGALLPSAMRFNCGEPAVRAKYDGLAVALGLGDAAGLICRIEALRRELGAEPLPADVLRRPEVLAEDALQDPCAQANPRPLDAAAVISILESAAATP